VRRTGLRVTKAVSAADWIESEKSGQCGGLN